MLIYGQTNIADQRTVQTNNNGRGATRGTIESLSRHAENIAENGAGNIHVDGDYSPLEVPM